MNINFADCQKKILSQFGQDGVIEKIFELIPPLNKFFVEFGSCGTDESMGNTAYMRRYGFDGLLMDCNTEPYGTHNEIKKYPVMIEFITAENIINIFKKYNVPQQFDLLSVDIDGNDYWVLKSLLTEYYPQVIVIESNYMIPSDRNIVWKYDPDFVWAGDCLHGASYQALLNLGIENGYSLVAICGCDMIFVRNESIPCDLIIENINDINKLITAKHDQLTIEASVKQINEGTDWINLDDKNPVIQNERDRPKPYIDKALNILFKNKNKFDIDIVEIGCMRSELTHNVDITDYECCNDGHSTYLFARTGLLVVSIDINRIHLNNAIKSCKQYENIEYIEEDAIKWAKEFIENTTIGLLFLDAWDVDLPESAEKHLEFYNLIKPLNDDCMILIDDTDLYWDADKKEFFYDKECLSGKGRLLIPQLLKDGYSITFKGRQTLLEKK